jgi:hypothetical protein
MTLLLAHLVLLGLCSLFTIASMVLYLWYSQRRTYNKLSRIHDVEPADPFTEADEAIQLARLLSQQFRWGSVSQLLDPAMQNNRREPGAILPASTEPVSTVTSTPLFESRTHA